MLRNYRISQVGTLFSEGIETEPPLTFQQRLQKRQYAIEEDFFVALLRSGIDMLHLLHPQRITSLAHTFKALSRPDSMHLSGPPDTRYMRPAGSGFVAAAIDLSPAAVLDAYGRGLILRWIAGRATWWAPAQRIAGMPRCAEEPAEALKLLASTDVRISLDRMFEDVARACARRAIQRGTPFQPGKEGLASLARLYDAGFAHCVEIKDAQGRLIGGCHGIATGRVFITQARFGLTRAASDLALVILNRHLACWNYAYHDLCADWGGQDFGFPVLGREDAQACLTGSLAGDRRGRWLAIPDLCDVSPVADQSNQTSRARTAM